MVNLFKKIQNLIHFADRLSFLAPLAIRLYLVPIFWMAGMNKLTNFASTAEWFGNTEWGLGLPMPHLMAGLATGAEVIGAACFLIGFATRWASIPLMITMIVAAVTVHLQNGWLAIASSSHEGAQRLHETLAWMQNNFPGWHDYVTELGKPVILNNGVEFAITYFIMLLALFFLGGGKYVSADYWLARKFNYSYKHSV